MRSTVQPDLSEFVCSRGVVDELHVENIPEIMTLERSSWIPGLQADEALIKKRFDLGHHMLGIRVDGVLRGMTCFSYTRFDPTMPGTLPATFAEFSTLPTSSNYNAAFGYNLHLHPDVRGTSLVFNLLKAGFQKLEQDGCQYLIGDGRCPSYNGSHIEGYEQVTPSPVFRKVLDDYVSTGHFPSVDALLNDPSLRFFYRTMDCNFIAIMRDFLPADIASGGFRVMYCKSFG